MRWILDISINEIGNGTLNALIGSARLIITSMQKSNENKCYIKK